jgi:hypothetical protein
MSDEQLPDVRRSHWLFYISFDNSSNNLQGGKLTKLEK